MHWMLVHCIGLVQSVVAEAQIWAFSKNCGASVIVLASWPAALAPKQGLDAFVLDRLLLDRRHLVAT